VFISTNKCAQTEEFPFVLSDTPVCCVVCPSGQYRGGGVFVRSQRHRCPVWSDHQVSTETEEFPFILSDTPVSCVVCPSGQYRDGGVSVRSQWHTGVLCGLSIRSVQRLRSFHSFSVTHRCPVWSVHQVSTETEEFPFVLVTHRCPVWSVHQVNRDGGVSVRSQ